MIGEIMDSPDIEEGALREALEGLQRINHLSETVEHILRPIEELAGRAHLNRISLLDIACGGGDVPIGIAKSAREFGVQVELTLMDRNSTALLHASQAAAEERIVCRCVQGDALSALPGNTFDVVTNSLFLHHVPTADEVIDLLRNLRGSARRMVVISDLRRSRLGLAGAWAGCMLLSESEIVRHDGPASVRAAWTVGELTDMAARAGMDQAQICRCWPWRMLLIWERGNGAGA
ncbi:MAG TPA: methyltransferase domain-containing protein [Tepidisphaeraceae bacterium]|nr:methyltransferase domain-containing protein [Tepidisphaeraceae bacterium]